MKNLYQTSIVLIVLLVGLSFGLDAQVSMMPENLIGTDLRKAESDLHKAVERGQKTQTINLAEVLYFSGQFEEALKYYQQADSLNLLRNPQQRRNYTHVARMFNVQSPYGVSTGYFDRDWTFETHAQAFCGNSRNEDFAPFKWNNYLFITSSRATPGGPESIARYYETFNIFNRARNQYFQNSSSSREELEAFFSDLEKGMAELEEFSDFLLKELQAGNKFMIDLAAFASPLASHEYNARLSERRNQSVKNYFMNWKGGALRSFIDDGSLLFIDKAYGDSQAPPSISEDPNERDKSVYSVKASRERRVVLFWKKVTETGTFLQGKNENHLHFIIVGSFKSAQRASKLIGELRDKGAPDPGIMQSGQNTYRVFYNRYDKIQEAIEELQKVRSSVAIDAWIVTL